MTTITFTIPNEHWLTSNMRLHWHAKAKRVAWLRELATKRVSEWGIYYRQPVRITAWIGYASNAKADPVNASETGKPLVDGLVAGGLFIDDSHEWVIGPDYRRDPVKTPRGYHTVRLQIETVDTP